MPRSPFATLRVEQLEDRVTPANLTFTGLRPNTPMSQWNWYDTSGSNGYVVPTQNDDLYFVGEQSPGDHTYLPVPMTAPEGSQMHMYMVMMGMPVNEAFQPNRNYTVPIDHLPTVRGIHLVDNYTQVDSDSGHVSVSSGQRLGTLDLHTGNLDQIGAYSHLYIGFYLGFLGGTLNSTSNTGSVVHLTGNITSPGQVATANLQPLLSSSLTIGSTISVEGLGYAGGGGALAQYGGFYNFTNGAGLFIDEFCFAQIAKPKPDPVTGTISGTIAVASDPIKGTFVVVSGGASILGDYSGGAVISVLSGGSLSINGKVDLSTIPDATEPPHVWRTLS